MTYKRLQAENAELRLRLEEAEETLRALRSGAVDAIVVEEPGGHRVYTLQSVDRPYRLFVEQMHQGAATLHGDGTIVYCNRQLSALLGTAEEKLVGATLGDFVIDEDRDTFDRLRRQVEAQAGQGEVCLRREDGGRVPAYLTFNELPSDSGASMGVLVTDLTAQKHYQQFALVHQALRESEERFRMLADNMVQLAWIGDQDGNITWYNQRWLEYTGCSSQAMTAWGWIEIQHPDHADRVLRNVAQARDTGEIWEDTFPLRAKDGQFHWFLSRAVPIRSEDGAIKRWFGTSTDVTELVRMEEALKEGDRRKDEFLAVLAHELRNPLAPIRNALNVLRITAQQDAAVEGISQMLERQVNHMVRLVDDLMEVSRITRGKIELRTEPVEVAAIMRSAVETSRPLIDAGQHDLQLELPSEPLMLEGDPVRLAQVLANLLNNAAKYTEVRGRIWFSATREGGYAVIRVRDSGMGISAEMLPRIFDLFTQVDRRANRAQGGLGIGLALVKSLAEMHGGSVAAHSDGISRGSEFAVRLPLSVGQRNSDAPAVAAAAAELPRRRFLVVDDNEDSADSLGMLLELVGAEVRVAYNGFDALAAYASYRPDVVMLDIGMPGMDGLEVARRIRSLPDAGNVTLIALTGWGQEEDRQRSSDAGFDAHLVKPVELQTLMGLMVSMDS